MYSFLTAACLLASKAPDQRMRCGDAQAAAGGAGTWRLHVRLGFALGLGVWVSGERGTLIGVVGHPWDWGWGSVSGSDSCWIRDTIGDWGWGWDESLCFRTHTGLVHIAAYS